MTVSLPMRAEATNRTVAQFQGKPFDWDGASCIHLAHAQAVNMGYNVPRLPAFRSRQGALRGLLKTGHQTLESLMDSMFQRIEPARMLVGDIGMLPGEDRRLRALVLFDGHLSVAGWHEADPSRLVWIKNIQSDLVAAWRL
jgi:hypothetical protein